MTFQTAYSIIIVVSCETYQYAEMAELADAQASGACGSNIVRVQVPFSALSFPSQVAWGAFFIYMVKISLTILAVLVIMSCDWGIIETD